jgi:hypothetical protein
MELLRTLRTRFPILTGSPGDEEGEVA